MQRSAGMYHHAITDFERAWGEPPAFVARAPGRVNLIGDHTDYTGGFVLPIAIDRSTWVGAGPRDGGEIHVHSGSMGESVVIPRVAFEGAGSAPAVRALPRWARYVAGVAAMLRRLDVSVPGANLRVSSDVPPGGGLSSSAALEVGTALALLRLGGAGVSPIALATLCRRAEHEFAGSPCGIMDPLCCVAARAGHALLLDCRDLAWRHVPLNLGSARVVVIDTGVRHAIADGRYAERREECRRTVARLQRVDPSITSLRRVNADRLRRCADRLDGRLAARVRHVVTENARVRMGAPALEAGDVQTFGRLMSESHASLRDDFQVSCAELDTVVALATPIDGVYGARMTGGGFGGCVVAIADPEALEPLRAALRTRYDPRFDTPARLMEVSAADGARVVGDSAHDTLGGAIPSPEGAS